MINPDGKSSGEFTFSVVAAVVVPAPAISSVSPNPVPGSDTAQSFTINGADFQSGANVTLRDKTNSQVFANRPVTSFAATRLQLNPNFTNKTATWSVEVINPDGKSSGEFTFSVLKH